MSDAHWQIAFEVSPKQLNAPSLQKYPTNLFHSAWRKLHRNKIHTPEWFAAWKADLPPGGCLCNYDDAFQAVPVRYNDWFNWSVDLHNWVNRKTFKDAVTVEQAIRIWKPEPAWRLKDLPVLVTAFGPKRIDRQQYCLETWISQGFRVKALQTSLELESFCKEFRNVEWVEENEISSGYEFNTQRIRRLCEEAKDDPVFLLNSDCSMTQGQGAMRLLERVQSKTPCFFVRWNYSEDTPVAEEFKWGLDGLLIWPEDIEAIPKQAPYAIGHSMWDYALPKFFKFHGRGFSIEHYPWLMHENHNQNWTEHSWQLGFDWLKKSGYEVDYVDMRSGAYRQSLDPEFVYSDGMWVPM